MSQQHVSSILFLKIQLSEILFIDLILYALYQATQMTTDMTNFSFFLKSVQYQFSVALWHHMIFNTGNSSITGSVVRPQYCSLPSLDIKVLPSPKSPPPFLSLTKSLTNIVFVFYNLPTLTATFVAEGNILKAASICGVKSFTCLG